VKLVPFPVVGEARVLQQTVKHSSLKVHYGATEEVAEKLPNACNNVEERRFSAA